MFKNFFLVFIIFFSSVSFASSNDKIVYLDIDYILNNSIPGKSILSQLDILNKDNIAELKKDELQIIEDEKAIIKKKNIISEEEFKNEIVKIEKKIQIFKDKKEDLVQKFNKKRQDQISKLLNLINPLLEDFMKNNSIGLILDKKNIFISISNYDITMKILKIVNENIKSISIE
jgi:Skp family chaperone for outer membrane proteins